MSTDPAWELFKKAARRQATERVPVALIADSPWLPGLAGINTLDYYLFQEQWLQINRSLFERWPEIAWIPGCWVEYGMAIEPSAFGARIHFYPNQPPSVEPVHGDLRQWAEIRPADPLSDGLMPLALRWMKVMAPRVKTEGLRMNVACARGPLAVGSWLCGITPLLEGFATEPELVYRFLESLTTTTIGWLQAQLDCMPDAEGILLLDDVVGMVSKRHYEALLAPHLHRIFNTFSGLVRIFHNDTPCGHLFGSLPEAGFDVFNFSHQVDLALALSKMAGRAVLMGNVPPLALGVRGSPEQVYESARACVKQAGGAPGLILSFGGGVSPGTPPENIDALLKASQDEL